MILFTLCLLVFSLAGPASADVFYLNPDGSVSDLRSGLLWQGSSRTVDSLAEARQICRQQSDRPLNWHLPTRHELISLEENLASLTPAAYWMQSGEVNGGIYCLGDGASFVLKETSVSAEVRCVADDPMAPVLESFKLWAESWEAANLDGYFASYMPDYHPHDKIGHEEWKAQRSSRLSHAGQIRLHFQPQEMRLLSRDRAELVMRQFYKSSRYQDKVLKRLILHKEGGRWLIAREEQLSTLPSEGLSSAGEIY